MAAFLVVRQRSGPSWQPVLAPEKQTNWPEHAASMDTLVESGFAVLGGPMVDE